MIFDKDDFAKERVRYQRIYSMPIMIKANDILELIDAICASLPDDNDDGKDLKVEALDLIAYIERAECRVTYSDKMECAVAARFEIRDMIENLYVAEKYDYIKQDYILILRESISEFKPLFAAWVKTFDKSDIYDDGWGLWV